MCARVCYCTVYDEREEKKEKKKKRKRVRTLKYWIPKAGESPCFWRLLPRIPRADPESRGPGKTVSGGDMGMCCCTAADAAEEGRRWPKANSHLLAGQGEPFDLRSPNLAAGGRARLHRLRSVCGKRGAARRPEEVDAWRGAPQCQRRVPASEE